MKNSAVQGLMRAIKQAGGFSFVHGNSLRQRKIRRVTPTRYHSTTTTKNNRKDKRIFYA